MTSIDMKYGFPLFTKEKSTVYMGNHKKLIISDIWSFWDYIIKKHKANSGFLNALLEQAKTFYNAAEASPMKSKPLLFYYSFLNLSKILICIEKGYTSSDSYMHGISENHKHAFANSEINLKSLHLTPKNVAIELAHILDRNPPPAVGPHTIKVKDLLIHCVGVHRAYSETYGKNEIFFRLEDIILSKPRGFLSLLATVRCNSSDLSDLSARGYVIRTTNGVHSYECSIPTTSHHITRRNYFDLSQKIRNQGVWYFVGNDGYTCYLSSSPTHRHEPELIIYLTMFYLGSITRYHPYMFDKIFSNKGQWLMSEFLTTQPKQFLYLSTAKLLGQQVLKAYTSF